MDSDWRNFEIVLPTEVGSVTAIIIIMITVTNTLTLLTFKRMMRLQFQHFLTICLAVVGLLTMLPYIISLIGFFRGFLTSSDNISSMVTVYSVSFIAETI